MISDNYVTGDNIYLRELQNFFFEVLGMMSITHYGAVGDGRVDNYGYIQVAIDDSIRRGISFLYVPYGRYRYRGEFTNAYKVIFVGNPHARIFNDRTGEEIKIIQFGYPMRNGSQVYDLEAPLVLQNGTAPELKEGFYYTGENTVKLGNTTIFNAGDMFYYDDKTKSLIGAIETLKYNNETWSRDIDTHYVKKTGDTMTGALKTTSLTAGTRKDGSTVGTQSLVAGRDCVASGTQTTAMGVATHATQLGAVSYGVSWQGDKIISSGIGSLAGGYQKGAGKIEASGTGSIAIGVVNDTSNNITTSGSGAFAGGTSYLSPIKAGGFASISYGAGTKTSRYGQAAFGICNIEESGSANTHDSTTGALVIGNGTSSDPSNAMKLTFAGDLYIAGTLHSNGADYAESVEWLDGNPNDEDRVGKFVVLENNKMRIATSQDSKELMGVVSAFPSVLGDSFDSYWHNKYVTDAYGRIQYETITIPEYTDEQGRVIPSSEVEVPMINPDYDPTQEYIPRRLRKEYGSFAMLGKLIVEDDGTCEVGGYCYPNDSGIGTKKYEGFYVLDRIDETHVKIYVK